MKMLPKDCVCVPVNRGELLVSPGLAVYCAVYADETAALHKHLADVAEPLPEALRERLEKHGFYGAQRPLRPTYHLTQFQVTNACNLRCAYCSADSGKAREHEISLDDVKRVIDEVLEVYPDSDISFSGGEPLTVPWLFEAVEYAQAHTKGHVGILSNLLLLDRSDALLEKVVSCMKRDVSVQMSFASADRDVCDRLSGAKRYDIGMRVLKKLEAHGVYPKIDLMLSAPDNQANVDAFADFRRSLAEDAKISLGFLYPCGRETGEHVYANEDDCERILDDLTFLGGVSIPAPKISPVTNRRLGCMCIEHENLYIRSDGGVFSCFKMVEQFGHISEGMKNVIERRRKTAHKASEIAMCRSCPFVSLCAGGCRADNMILERSVRAPICGKWRVRFLAEMLFEDRPYVMDWSVPHQLEEAKKRGIETPSFVIVSARL